MASFLATGLGAGTSLPPAPGARLDAYTVIDDVVVPPECERYVIVHWGDRVFPRADDYVGYNADYTAFIPIRGRDNDGYLWVNHEYVSYPISSIAPAIAAGLNGRPTTDLAVLGFSLPTGASLASLTPAERRLLLDEFYYNQGGSVIRIARASRKARFEVVGDPRNRRLHGLSGLALNAERTDGYQAVIAWGDAPRQQGDLSYVLATGRAAREVFPLSSDGLGARIIGTGFNCSGATTPWQTVLSAEENFQGSSSSYMGVQENLLPNGTQTEYVAGTSGQEFGLVGEKYGWMVEIDRPCRVAARENTLPSGSGRHVFLYHHPTQRDEPMEIDFGIEVVKAFENAGAVKCVSTPEGQVAMAIHAGALTSLPQTHMAIHQWCAENGHGIGGFSWETYTWGDGPNPVETVVRYALR